MTHIPVLQKEVIEYLNPKPNENFIDCTIDGGGHSLAIIEKIIPSGKILGVDLDEKLLHHLKFKIQKRTSSACLRRQACAGRQACGRAKIKNNLITVCGNYVNLKEIVEKKNFKPVNGVLLDLGMSSWHLEESGRGFSFLKDEPLDMRYNVQNLTAGEIINKWPEKEIERILREYGEERFAEKIAKEIIEEREKEPIKSTFQLVEVIKKAVPKKYQRGKIHCACLRRQATKTFQALRIAVNDELNNLKKVLPQAIEVLEKGGRIAIISFHSLEDRIVKNFFKEEIKKGTLKLLTKKPITPSSEEIKSNPRARSAKLRAAIKLITNN